MVIVETEAGKGFVNQAQTEASALKRLRMTAC